MRHMRPQIPRSWNIYDSQAGPAPSPLKCLSGQRHQCPVSHPSQVSAAGLTRRILRVQRTCMTGSECVSGVGGQVGQAVTFVGGAFAEYTTVSAAGCWPVREASPEAACLAISGLTAIGALEVCFLLPNSRRTKPVTEADLFTPHASMASRAWHPLPSFLPNFRTRPAG